MCSFEAKIIVKNRKGIYGKDFEESKSYTDIVSNTIIRDDYMSVKCNVEVKDMEEKNN